MNKCLIPTDSASTRKKLSVSAAMVVALAAMCIGAQAAEPTQSDSAASSTSVVAKTSKASPKPAAKSAAKPPSALPPAEVAVWIERAKASQFPAPIAAMVTRGQGVRVLDVFAAPGGLVGYVVVAGNGEQRIYYVTQDGSAAFYGLAFDGQLNNLTAQHIASFTNPLSPRSGVGTLATEPKPAGAPSASVQVQQPTAAKAQAFNEQLLWPSWDLATKALGGFVEGQGMDVYIVFDPACPFCHKTWNVTRQFTNRLRIHWVPVAELGDRSRRLAQTFMTLPDQQKPAAMAALVSQTLPQATQVGSDVGQALATNSAILHAANVKNVPLIMYVDRGQIRSMVGAPNAKQLQELVDAAAINAR